MSTVNPNQVNTSVFGMASAVFTSMCGALVTTAVKGTTLVEKTGNTLIHGVGAAEHVAKAVEDRSEIYGRSLVEGGKLVERANTLKLRLRLHNLERQEQAALAGLDFEVPETMSDKLNNALTEAKKAALGETSEGAEDSLIRNTVPIRK